MRMPIILKTADIYSTTAKRFLKKLRSFDPALLDDVFDDLTPAMIKKMKRIDLQDMIRERLLPKKYLGEDTGGYIYRVSNGDMTGHSGVESRLLSDKRAKDSLIWVAPDPKSVLSYAGEGDTPLWRFPVKHLPKKELRTRVTRPELDPRGVFYPNSPMATRKDKLSAFRKNPTLFEYMRDYGKKSTWEHHNGGNVEAVLNRPTLSKAIAEHPSDVQKLPNPLVVNEGGIHHRAILSPDNKIIWSQILMKPSMFRNNPLLRSIYK